MQEQNQYKNILKILGSFLEKNGFSLIENDNHFANEMCSVVITETDIEVADNNGWTIYSKDHNIYWLIGYLTYSGYISKNYKI